MATLRLCPTHFPVEPWNLRGQMHVSTFLVPLADVPVDLPPGCTPDP